MSEIYKSYQGEGPNTGIPTVFVRFAGCNLKCPGWACDTQHAIDPKLFMKDSTVYEDPTELARDITSYIMPGDNVCFTGGEVMLQNAHDLESAVVALTAHTGVDVELFTHGTFKMDRNFRTLFTNIIMDWKLPGTGEVIRPEWSANAVGNLRYLTSADAVKFTVANLSTDMDEAQYRYTNIIQGLRNKPEIYCGVVWGKVAEAELASELVRRELPWRLNVQLHKYLWNPDARRT